MHATRRAVFAGLLLLVAGAAGCVGDDGARQPATETATQGPSAAPLTPVGNETFQATLAASAAIDLGGPQAAVEDAEGELSPPDEATVAEVTVSWEAGPELQEVRFLLLACDETCEDGAAGGPAGRELARAEGPSPLSLTVAIPEDGAFGWEVGAQQGAAVQQTLEGEATYLSGPPERPAVQDGHRIRTFPASPGSNVTPPAILPDPSPEPLGFATPVQPFGDHPGFEPSIAIGPAGELYATAAQGGDLATRASHASWLAYSTDTGSQWSPLPSPQQAHERQPGLEGDIAVDGQGRLYFVDTYLPDNSLSRWSPGADGPTWDFSRPVQVTAGVDDRPWLAAHGDGIVYYIGNNGVGLPTPGNLAETEQPSRMWLSVSEDGGQTFQLRHGFPNSLFCTPAASPVDDLTLAVVCSRVEGLQGLGPDPLLEGYVSEIHVSHDRGKTWTTTELRHHQAPPAENFPAVAFDEEGNPYAIWGEGDGPTRLFVARLVDGTWEVLDATPYEGTFQRTWIAAGSDGTVAAVFYGSDPTAPGAKSSTWFAYALVTPDAEADQPIWELARITPEPVSEAEGAPGDFFQDAFGPDGTLHVVFDRGAGPTSDRRVFYTHSLQP